MVWLEGDQVHHAKFADLRGDKNARVVATKELGESNFVAFLLIEDTAEIRLAHPNLVRFEARRARMPFLLLKSGIC